MLKVIPIGAILLLSLGSAYAQNGTDTDDSSPSVTTTTPAPTSSPNGTTDPTLTGTTDTTNGAGGLGTPVTTGTPTDSAVDTTTPVTSVPVTTPATPVTTSTPSNSTNVSPTPMSSTTTSTTTTTSFATVNSFTCTGNAPAWNLSISKDLITYSTAKDRSVKLKAVTPMAPVGDTSGSLQVYSAKGADGKPVTILVRKNTAGCSNGLTGQSYQYDAYVVFPNMVVMGCCNPV